MTQLVGKHILLTGGSRGIGPVIAERLASRGAHIALAARSEQGLAAVVEALKKFDVETMAVAADIAESSQRQKLVASVSEKFGKIDILINNAGLETEGAYIGLPWEDIRRTIEVNLVAPMELTYLLLPGMVARRSGHIVNISSIAGKCGAPYAATYDATKAGLAEWAQGLRLELANSGVMFSTIFPGYVTEVGMFARFNVVPPAIVGSCTPSQVANAVVKSIERNILEVVVNSTPQRWFYALKELFPSLGDWLLKKFGVVDFQRKKVGL